LIRNIFKSFNSQNERTAVNDLCNQQARLSQRAKSPTTYSKGQRVNSKQTLKLAISSSCFYAISCWSQHHFSWLRIIHVQWSNTKFKNVVSVFQLKASIQNNVSLSKAKSNSKFLLKSSCRRFVQSFKVLKWEFTFCFWRICNFKRNSGASQLTLKWKQ